VVQASTNDTLLRQIQSLEYELQQLKEKLKDIQSNCNHTFIEKEGMRKCLKCHLAESTYY